MSQSITVRELRTLLFQVENQDRLLYIDDADTGWELPVTGLELGNNTADNKTPICLATGGYGSHDEFYDEIQEARK